MFRFRAENTRQPDEPDGGGRSLTLPGLARRSDKPSAARRSDKPPGGGPKGVGGRRPRIVKERWTGNPRLTSTWQDAR
eukprot:1189098-Prorocentrum_minimum.AAC.1